MPKTKGKTFPPVRVDDFLYDFTVKCAAEADEYLSVYIRKAIKMRNTQNKQEIPREFKTVVDTPAIIKPTILELKEKIKKMETNKVNTLFKGQK